LEVLPSILSRRLPHISIETCPSSHLAATKLATGHYDVAIIDLMMPEIDGFGVLADLRQTRPCTSILFITGRKELTLVERALSDGALDFLGKPVDTKELTWSVGLAVRLHRLRRRIAQHERYVYQLQEVVNRPGTKLPAAFSTATIDTSVPLTPASLEHIKRTVSRSQQVIERAERMLYRREDHVRQKALRRHSS